ncbi:MAG: SDR family NAD(P)-dependent oxidoreductase [Deltaproteobacteria bacterium]|nr:SDR family NAD(P)-dependent oxidoreductase [Deltaproteobacteria bacterium]
MFILVTGCAGFIGWMVSRKLIQEGYHVIGIDNMNNYYDRRLKEWRLKDLQRMSGFSFYRVDIEDKESLVTLFRQTRFDAVINLAAMAGVRGSIRNPHIYFTTNVLGSLNLLELMKEHKVQKYVLASTSSLYAGQKEPFKETLDVSSPISPYAASKKAAEVLAYTYHYLYGIDVTVLRYFTVYGPAGRPDMSIFRLIYCALKGKEAKIFGDGTQRRDFTYVENIAEGTVKSLKPLGFEIINLGSSASYTLNEVIELIEKYTQRTIKKKHCKFNRADLRTTCADITKARYMLDWVPSVNLEQGIKETVEWMIENWDWLRKVRISGG